MSDDDKTTKYRPSNGSEGEWFMSQWCERCIKDSPNQPCSIIGRAMGMDLDDAGYPAEWIEDGHGPRCTAFEVMEGGRE